MQREVWGVQRKVVRRKGRLKVFMANMCYRWVVC